MIILNWEQIKQLKIVLENLESKRVIESLEQDIENNFGENKIEFDKEKDILRKNTDFGAREGQLNLG